MVAFVISLGSSILAEPQIHPREQSSFLPFSISSSRRIILFSHPPAVFAMLTGAAIDNKRYASHRLAKY